MIRAMLPSEQGAVAGLFAGAAEAAHWSEQDLAQLVASGARVWVEVEDAELAGAAASREAAGESEILNLAVAAGRRRRGTGRRLMQAALAAAAAAGAKRAFLEVRESNAGARAFYSKMGFVEDGRRRNYYREPVEDALLLSRTL